MNSILGGILSDDINIFCFYSISVNNIGGLLIKLKSGDCINNRWNYRFQIVLVTN